MASGVTLTSDVLTKYKQGNTWKYIIFGLVNRDQEIGVLKESPVDDYDAFLKELPENNCRWAVYDFEYESGEGKRSRRVFYQWTPDTAKVKEKMLYASSKLVLRQSLPGFLTDVQGTELSEVLLDAVKEKIMRR